MNTVYFDPVRTTKSKYGSEYSTMLTKLRSTGGHRVGERYRIGSIEMISNEGIRKPKRQKYFRSRTNKQRNYNAVAYVTDSNTGERGRIFFNYEVGKEKVTGKSRFNDDGYLRRLGQHIRKKAKAVDNAISSWPAIPTILTTYASFVSLFKLPPESVWEGGGRVAGGLLLVPAITFTVSRKVDYGYKKKTTRRQRSRIPKK